MNKTTVHFTEIGEVVDNNTGEVVTGETDWDAVKSLSDDEVEESARKDPDSRPLTDKDLAGSYRVTNVKTSVPSSYERFGTYQIHDVLDFVPGGEESWDGYKRLRTYDGNQVKMSSTRYRCFKNSGTTCVVCGIQGKYFALERHKSQTKSKRYHFNLYAIDTNGEEVLMTKDHITPRSLGGSNDFTNMQTMCIHCNHAKGNGRNEKVNEEISKILSKEYTFKEKGCRNIKLRVRHARTILKHVEDLKRFIEKAEKDVQEVLDAEERKKDIEQ
jgi:5-methylcytosine-specific restriction endonuclease McrA